jgi:hypothetical protein
LRAARERAARRRWLSEDGAAPERPAAAADDPAERVLARERAAALAAAIATLPGGQRDALVLFHLAGLPQHAVASRLTTGEGAVRTRLDKARTALRARLAGEDEPQPKAETEENDMTSTAMPAEIADVRRTTGGRHVVLLSVAGATCPSGSARPTPRPSPRGCMTSSVPGPTRTPSP